jgi:hypothetical protein
VLFHFLKPQKFKKHHRFTSFQPLANNTAAVFGMDKSCLYQLILLNSKSRLFTCYKAYFLKLKHHFDIVILFLIPVARLVKQRSNYVVVFSIISAAISDAA